MCNVVVVHPFPRWIHSLWLHWNNNNSEENKKNVKYCWTPFVYVCVCPLYSERDLSSDVSVWLCVDRIYYSVPGKGDTENETINISYFFSIFKFFWRFCWKFQVYTIKRTLSPCSIRGSAGVARPFSLLFSHSRLKICLPCARTSNGLPVCVYHLYVCILSSHDLQHIYHSHTSIHCCVHRFLSCCSCCFQLYTVTLIKTFLSFYMTSPNVLRENWKCVARSLINIIHRFIETISFCSYVWMGGTKEWRVTHFRVFQFSDWLRLQSHVIEWKTTFWSAGDTRRPIVSIFIHFVSIKIVITTFVRSYILARQWPHFLICVVNE